MTPYYQDDAVTIYLGDCREILPALEPVDLVLTDPPYGINHKSHGQIFRSADIVVGDDNLELAKWTIDCLGGLPLCMFFSPYNPVGEWRSILVWNKGAHVGIGGDRETCWKRDFELIGISGNEKLAGQRDSAVLNFNALSPPPTGHFCEKPVALIKYLLRKLGGETILDPFMGSGTTLRAAKDLGRKAIGIEIEEKYCEIAAKRMAQEVLPL